MIDIPSSWVSEIAAWAAFVGTISVILQAIIQKEWWSPKVKAVLTIVFAVVTGTATYIVEHGLNFANPQYLAGWILGAYGAIQIAYQALKRPVLDPLEVKVNGGTPTGVQDADDLEDFDGHGPVSRVPDPYGHGA